MYLSTQLPDEIYRSALKNEIPLASPQLLHIRQLWIKQLCWRAIETVEYSRFDEMSLYYSRKTPKKYKKYTRALLNASTLRRLDLMDPVALYFFIRSSNCIF